MNIMLDALKTEISKLRKNTRMKSYSWPDEEVTKRDGKAKRIVLG